jgi:hypothetical protein
MKTGDIKRIAVVSVLLGSLASGCTAAYTTVKDEPRASVHLASVEAAQTFYDAHIMENYAWRRDDRDAGWSVSAGIDVPAPFERNKMVTDNVKFNNAIRETDTNHDGTISDAEAKAYAAKILRRNIPRSFQTSSNISSSLKWHYSVLDQSSSPCPTPRPTPLGRGRTVVHQWQFWHAVSAGNIVQLRTRKGISCNYAVQLRMNADERG